MGGIQQASSNLANELSKRGVCVYFLTLFPNKAFFLLHPSVVLINAPSNLNSGSLSIVNTIFWIRSNFKKLNIPTVIVFNKLYSAIAAIALLGLKCNLIISERSSPLYKWDFATRLVSRLFFMFRSPNIVIAQTRIAADYQKRDYSKSIIKIIPNIVREVRLYPQVERQNIILCVGRFGDTCKGFDRMMQAFELLDPKNWELHFAGGSIHDAGELISVLEKRSLLNKIKFLGKVDNIDLVFASASIFVIPSRSEGFPNALCEAMAAGLPCVSFDFVAGPSEIITDKHDGLIVKDGDIKGLNQAISFLINNPNERQRIGNNALSIRERFSGPKIIDSYLNLLIN